MAVEVRLDTRACAGASPEHAHEHEPEAGQVRQGDGQEELGELDAVDVADGIADLGQVGAPEEAQKIQRRRCTENTVERLPGAGSTSRMNRRFGLRRPRRGGRTW